MKTNLNNLCDNLSKYVQNVTQLQSYVDHQSQRSSITIFSLITTPTGNYAPNSRWYYASATYVKELRIDYLSYRTFGSA